MNIAGAKPIGRAFESACDSASDTVCEAAAVSGDSEAAASRVYGPGDF